MAPEVATRIKADRWACGRVILFLDTFKKRDELVGTFARSLCNYNPELRSRLHHFRTLDLYSRQQEKGFTTSTRINESRRRKQEAETRGWVGLQWVLMHYNMQEKPVAMVS